ncbi:hypothetical protein N2152v2_001766 [Parachlorella kessleri]
MSKKFLDIVGLSDGSDSDSESAEEEAPPKQPTKKSKQEIDVEKLKEHGYKGGLSVLLVPEKQEEGQANWAWSSGAERRQAEPEDESFEERQQNREAVSSKAEESAQYARKAMDQAARLRQEKAEERERLKEEKNLSWKQKEKRKRDAGKQSRGKNYVEEEKRKAREFGVFSGFD